MIASALFFGEAFDAFGAGWPAWFCAWTAKNWWAPSSKPARLRVFYIGTNNVDAGLLKGINEGRVGSKVGHGVNEDCPHVGIGEVGSAFVGFLSRHS